MKVTVDLSGSENIMSFINQGLLNALPGKLILNEASERVGVVQDAFLDADELPKLSVDLDEGVDYNALQHQNLSLGFSDENS